MSCRCGTRWQVAQEEAEYLIKSAASRIPLARSDAQSNRRDDHFLVRRDTNLSAVVLLAVGDRQSANLLKL